MAKIPTLYELFDPTSLIRLQRSIAEGKLPNAEELAAVLEANSERPLPPWFVELIIKGPARPVKKAAGPTERRRLVGDSFGAREAGISALPCMAAETPEFIRAARLVGRAGKRLVGWSPA